MIKIASNPKYSAPCTFNRPIDGGKTEAVSFSIVFKRHTQTEIEAIHKRAQEAAEEEAKALALTEPNEREAANLARKQRNEKFVHDVVVGWGPDVQDAEGKALEFTPGNLNVLLDEHGARGAIIDAFFKSINGAAAKN